MTRKVWLGVAMLATGVTLLVAAGLAAGATGGAKSAQAVKGSHAKTGLSMNIDLSSTDFDYLDPALAYADWSWQFTYLMNCKLLNYPDKNAPEGTKLQAEAADFPVVSKGGTVYTFTIKPDAGGTLLTFHHAQFVDETARDNHQRGWTEFLGNLAQYVDA